MDRTKLGKLVVVASSKRQVQMVGDRSNFHRPGGPPNCSKAADGIHTAPV